MLAQALWRRNLKIDYDLCSDNKHAMRPIKFIELARRMAVLFRGDPAGVRSIVSRAYYGTFHEARLLIEELGYPVPRTENGHRFVQVRLLNAGNDHARTLGSLLCHLHERRKKADYDLEEAAYESENFMVEAIARTDRAARILDECCAEPARTEIQTGIAQYHARINSPGG
ncbi:MAG TPA: hypothetical protein VFI31_10690 [Pirellulales bacterium]|nr:hypothetical protein [Pirellulales bacterium]